jgi:uncharacterized protein with PIN domain
LRVFIDTASLVKRFIQEDGSVELERLFEEASEIVVSPITWIEFNAALTRRQRNKSLS